MKIEVHPLTHNPTAAWAELSKNQKLYKINVTTPNTPVADDKVGNSLLSTLLFFFRK